MGKKGCIYLSKWSLEVVDGLFVSKGALDMSDVIRFATLVKSYCFRLIYFQTNIDTLALDVLCAKIIAPCLNAGEEP